MKDNFIIIRNSDIIKRIYIEQILFVSVDADCLTFWVQNNDQFSCSRSLKEIESKLPDYFFKISRQYLVNTWKISEIRLRQRKIILSDGIELPVSVRKIKSLALHLSENSIRS